MDLKKIGSFLKELRKEKGITQEELAEMLYVSGSMLVFQLLSGQFRKPIKPYESLPYCIKHFA